MGVVYQAFDKEREMRVALKTLLHMDTESLYYFKREFRVLHDVVHPNLCSFMELFNDENSWFLTMELIEGVDFLSYVKNRDKGSKTLSSVFRNQFDSFHQTRSSLLGDKNNWAGLVEPPPFDERRLRKCLFGLCEGLSALHAAGKVHRDIKPSNVLITEDERVVLMDFGLITEREMQRQTELGVIVGTAAYMAPEQAASDTVGPEADWYAVGVMLYEVLTGKLPFDGYPLNIILEKQANTPERPGNIQAGLPEDLENLCFVLLNRDPKSRPHPADFLNLFDAYSNSITNTFVTNVTDFTQAELYVGREEECKILKENFHKVTEGSFETVIIEGVSGVGKSALVNHFSSNIISDDESAVVLTGRCYEHESAPFKAFDGIVECLIRYLRNFSSEEAMNLKPEHHEYLLQLFHALGRSNFFANLPVPKIEVEDHHELRRRSFAAFKEMLSALGKNRPLVVVIDDMQWTDPDSLNLLEQLVCEDGAPQMLLILLSRYLDESAKSALDWDSIVKKRTTRLHLKPLSMSESTALTRMFLSREQELIGVDPELIAIEADGHPLYIAELVKHLAISHGAEWKRLRLDDAIWQRINLLPETAVDILQIVCIAGSPINRKHVQALSQTRSEDFHRYLSLLRAGKFIKSRKLGRGHVIEPYHDKVRESVLAKVASSGEAARIHFNIGLFLLRIYSEKELDEDIFTVVRHLHAGRELIEENSERIALAELYFLAGKKSKDTAAYMASLAFFKEGIALLSSDAWKEQYDLAFSLHCDAAQAAFFTGEYALNQQLVHEAMSQARSILDKAKIYETYVLSLDADGKPIEAIDKGIEMLRALGIKLPSRPGKLYLFIRTIVTKLRLTGKTTEHLESLTPATEPRIAAAGKLLSTIGGIAYLHMTKLWFSMVYELVRLALKYGVSSLSSVSFGAWAVLNCAVFHRYDEGYKFGKISLSLTERFQDKSKTAISLMMWANFVQHRQEHIRATLPSFLKCHQMAQEAGDIFYWVYSGVNYCYHSFYASTHLPRLARDCERYGKIITHDKHEMAFKTNRIFYQTVLNFIGPSDDCTQLVGEIYNEIHEAPRHVEKKHYITLLDLHSCKMVLSLYFNDYALACDSALNSTAYARFAPGTYTSAVLPFYQSLAYLKHYGKSDKSMRRKLLRRVRKNQKRYQNTVNYSPANHAHKFQFVEAERARVSRKTEKAATLYHESISGAIEQGFVQDAALACEFAADFYKELRDDTKAISYAREALGHYEKWGALAKVAHIKEKFELP